MRILTYSFETSLEFSETVTSHSFILRCSPKSTPFQTVLESQMILSPNVHVDELTDGFGNRLHAGYLAAPHDGFTFMSYGMVMTDACPLGPEQSHPMFLQPSTYTMPSDACGRFVGSVLQTIPHAPAWDKAVQLMHAVHGHFAYEPGATTVRTTASEAFALAKGVCQDYSQVLILSCRLAGIPARYCAGLMEGEGATHAWVEVFDGMNWRGLDPTNDRLVDESYIMLSYGRDFEDCSIERGVFLGSPEQTQHVSASVTQERGMDA